MSAAEATIASLRSDGSEIIAIGAVMLVLAFVSVLLRLVSKAFNEEEYGLDDILIGLALLWYTISESLILRAVDVGRHAVNGNSPEYTTYLELTWIYSFLYWWSVSFATLSILALYRRIFSTHRFFSVASTVLMFLTVAWWLSGTLTNIFSFRPIRAYWDSSVTGQYYINYNDFWITTMVAELVIETAVIALPIREIARLTLSKRKKVLIMGLFCMGGLVIITGIVGICYAWRKDMSHSLNSWTTTGIFNYPTRAEHMTPGTIWLAVHSAVAIVSANLPTYRPLISRIPGVQLVSLVASRRGSYSKNYRNTSIDGHSRKASPSRRRSTITKRAKPTAKLNVDLANQAFDKRASRSTDSYDATLLGSNSKPVGKSNASLRSSNTDFAVNLRISELDKSLELEDLGEEEQQSRHFEGENTQNRSDYPSTSMHGLTKQLSIPSPTSTDGAWGPLMDSEYAKTAPEKFRWNAVGPATRRAEFEYEADSKRGRLARGTGLATSD